MTGKEIVLLTVAFRNPPRVPVFMFNKDTEFSDIVMLGYHPDKSFKTTRPKQSEFMYWMETLDDTSGHPTEPALKKWNDFDNFPFPDGRGIDRMRHMKEACVRLKDKYIIGSLGLSGWTQFLFVRGFENAMMDLYDEEENSNRLLDKIFLFENQIIENFCRFPIDAIAFYDDWGMQNSLMISEALWVKYFKPRYKEQFALIKRLGKQIFFHSCGHILTILPHLIELGVDIVNMNGMEVMGFEKLKKYAGKITFCNPVDLQSVALNADRKTIFDYTKRMINTLGTPHGGYIGYVEEYSSIGLTDENYKHCWDALKQLGAYKR